MKISFLKSAHESSKLCNPKTRKTTIRKPLVYRTTSLTGQLTPLCATEKCSFIMRHQERGKTRDGTDPNCASVTLLPAS